MHTKVLKNPKLRNRIIGVEEVGMDSISWEKGPAVCSLEHGYETCCSVKLSRYLYQQRDWEF
jgi:hypothetical protein